MLKIISSFRREIYSDSTALNDAFKEEINLKLKVEKFNKSPKPNNLNKKKKNVLTYKNKIKRDFLKGEESSSFESKIFSLRK